MSPSDLHIEHGSHSTADVLAPVEDALRTAINSRARAGRRNHLPAARARDEVDSGEKDHSEIDQILEPHRGACGLRPVDKAYKDSSSQQNLFHHVSSGQRPHKVIEIPTNPSWNTVSQA